MYGVEHSTPSVRQTIAQRWRMDHASIAEYARSMPRYTRDSRDDVAWAPARASRCLGRNREHSMGVRVNATSRETMMENAIVKPKLLSHMPMMPFRNPTGMKMTTSDNVVALTARPTSAVAARAASKAFMPFSSM